MPLSLNSRKPWWNRPARDWVAGGAVVVALLAWTIEPATANDDPETALDTARDVIFVPPTTAVDHAADAAPEPTRPANRWGLTLSTADTAAIDAHVAALNATVRPIEKREPSSYVDHTNGHGEYLSTIGAHYN
jgi:hypothetical protein